MPRYLLVAARDGDLISETAECPNDEAAEGWAFGTLVERFGLGEFEFDDLEEAIAETDGYDLSIIPADPVVSAAERMLGASVKLFEGVDPSHFDRETFGNYAHAAIALARALQQHPLH